MSELQGGLLFEPYVGGVDDYSEHVTYHVAAGAGWK